MHAQEEQPVLLMLSHCLPAALGSSARARAWQLLRLASRSHRVYLVCRLDGPVRLDQWQTAKSRARRLTVQMPPHSTLTRRLTDERSLTPEIQDILGGVKPDALFCTHPSLWAEASRIPARVRICDMDTPARDWTRQAAGRRRAGFPWPWRRTASPRFLLDHLRNTFDLLTLGHAGYLDQAHQAGCTTIVLPGALDLAFFGQPGLLAEESDPAGPRLVFHTNWQQSDHAVNFSWFRRHVWPKVKATVPDAQLHNTQTAQCEEPFGALRAASVVVSPETDPGLARWPVLQAMATNRPLIVPQDAVRDLGVRHGEHLLTARRPDDWAGLCIESLRSARVRVHLARGARAFLEDHGVIDDAGGELLNRLGASSPTPTPLATAA